MFSHVWLFATPCTPGLSVHHQLPESTQTHVHCVGDAIQPSHPLSSPSPPAISLSRHQSLFKWVSSSHQVAKVLEFKLQHQSLRWTPRTDALFVFFLSCCICQICHIPDRHLCYSFVTFQIDTCARITNISVKLFKNSFIVWDFLGAAVPTQKTYVSAFCLGKTHAPFIHQLKLLLWKISFISLRSGGESGNCLSSEVIKNNPRT